MQNATPWAVLLCKFTDNDAEPFTTTYYKNLFTNAGTGLSNMVDFYRDYSHGSVDLGGSRVYGWLTLPESLAEARAKGRGLIFDDARATAAAQGIDLSPFWGLMVFTNVPFETFGLLDGRAACADSYGTEPRVLAQEVGHGYGLNHSMADGVAAEYQDPWDVMSALNAMATPNPSFGQVGPGLNAANMDSRGWLDPERVWSRAGWFDEEVELRPHHRRDLPGFLVARVGGFYVELRIKEGWDAGIISSAVLVHRLEAGRSWLMSGSGQRFLPVGAVFERSDGTRRSRVEVLGIDPAKRQATVRLSLQSTIRPLKISIRPYPVRWGKPVSLTIDAADALTGNPVEGEVHLYTFDKSTRRQIPAFPTGTPKVVTLRPQLVFDPETHTWTDADPPGGSVTAPGYQQVSLLFDG